MGMRESQSFKMQETECSLSGYFDEEHFPLENPNVSHLCGESMLMTTHTAIEF